jgi:hypothetical protein
MSVQKRTIYEVTVVPGTPVTLERRGNKVLVKQFGAEVRFDLLNIDSVIEALGLIRTEWRAGNDR